jgi:hypothetical protein
LSLSSIGKENFRIVEIKGQILFNGEIITNNAKRRWDNLKIFTSRTTKPEKVRLT